jgi:hypothetical protein
MFVLCQEGFLRYNLTNTLTSQKGKMIPREVRGCAQGCIAKGKDVCYEIELVFSVVSSEEFIILHGKYFT